MKICKLLVFSGRVRERMPVDCMPIGECPAIKGKIEAVTLQLPSTFWFRINGRNYEFFLYCGKSAMPGTQFPRIDVGEEVIIHAEAGNVKGVQVIKKGKVVFRFLTPQEVFKHGARLYIFDDMDRPKQIS